MMSSWRKGVGGLGFFPLNRLEVPVNRTYDLLYIHDTVKVHLHLSCNDMSSLSVYGSPQIGC